MQYGSLTFAALCAPCSMPERPFRRGLSPLFYFPALSKRDKRLYESLDCLPVEFTAFMW